MWGSEGVWVLRGGWDGMRLEGTEMGLMYWKEWEVPPHPPCPGRPAYAQPLSP